jgi:fumarate hydratase class II
MGTVAVPASALWGAQTQRVLDRPALGTHRLPPAFIRALALEKWAAARTNAALGELTPAVAEAIGTAALAIAAGEHDDAFPLGVFQTGSATSSHMNVNEVIATLAARTLGKPVHPNDDVNRSQSSNDSVPTAIHVAAALLLRAEVLPALDHLATTIERRARELDAIVKTGRTHLMDALPLTLGQELGAWATQVRDAITRLESTEPRLLRLAQGGTAVGSGVNAPPGFGERVAAELAARTGIPFTAHPDRFAALAGQETAAELSGQLRVAAITLGKIANDLRWMNSGPLAGLAEIALPALQPGSSIMPGKVNPVIAEAVAMVAAQVVGNDATVAFAAQSGNFQLNVMLPVIARNLIESLELIARAARSLADDAIAGLTVNTERLEAQLARNPMLVTALNARIGYEAGAAIAKEAYASGEAILDVALRRTGLPRDLLEPLLDPARLTGRPVSDP